MEKDRHKRSNNGPEETWLECQPVCQAGSAFGGFDHPLMSPLAHTQHRRFFDEPAAGTGADSPAERDERELTPVDREYTEQKDPAARQHPARLELL